MIDALTGKVNCNSDGLKNRIQKAVDRFQEALRPCALEIEDK